MVNNLNSDGVHCYICGSDKLAKRDGKVRDNPNLEILECCECGLVFLSQDSHISEEFYENSGMHGDSNDLPNINEWLIENRGDDSRRFDYLQQQLINSKILDFGCGVGGFLLKAREIAKEANGVELESRLQPHYQENHLTVFQALNKIPEDINYDLITAFHVVEHLRDPRNVLLELGSLIAEKGKIIIEVPHANDALLTLYKNKPFSEFTYWSCHLYLFSPNSLRMLGEQAGFNVDYIQQTQRYPLSNHLNWLINGEPGGHKQFGFLDSLQLNSAYTAQLSSIGMCDTLVACFTKK